MSEPRYSFDHYIRWQARIRSLSDQSNESEMIRALSADPNFFGITQRVDAETYLTCPGNPDGDPGDWSKPAWSEILPGYPTIFDIVWEQEYLPWRQESRRRHREIMRGRPPKLPRSPPYR